MFSLQKIKIPLSSDQQDLSVRHPLSHKQKDALSQLLERKIKVNSKDNSFSQTKRCRELIDLFLESTHTLLHLMELDTFPFQHKVTLRGGTNGHLILGELLSSDVDTVIKIGLPPSFPQHLFTQYCRFIAMRFLHKLSPKFFQKTATLSYNSQTGFETDAFTKHYFKQETGIFSKFKVIESQLKCILSLNSVPFNTSMRRVTLLDITFQFGILSFPLPIETTISKIGTDSISFAHDAVELIFGNENSKVSSKGAYFSPLFGYAFSQVQDILIQKDLIILDPEMFGGCKRFFSEITKGKIPINSLEQKNHALEFIKSFLKTPQDIQTSSFFHFLKDKIETKSCEFGFRVLINTLTYTEILKDSLNESESCDQQQLENFFLFFLSTLHIYVPLISPIVTETLYATNTDFWPLVKKLYALKAQLDIDFFTENNLRQPITTIRSVGPQAYEDRLSGFFISPPSSLDDIITWNEMLASQEHYAPIIPETRRQLLTRAPYFLQEQDKIVYLYFINKMLKNYDRDIELPSLQNNLPRFLSLLISYPDIPIEYITPSDLKSYLRQIATKVVSPSSSQFLSSFFVKESPKHYAALIQICLWIDKKEFGFLKKSSYTIYDIFDIIFKDKIFDLKNDSLKYPEHVLFIFSSEFYNFDQINKHDFIEDIHNLISCVDPFLARLLIPKLITNLVLRISEETLLPFLSEMIRYPIFYNDLKTAFSSLTSYHNFLIEDLYEKNACVLPSKKLIPITCIKLLSLLPQSTSHPHKDTLWNNTLTAPIEEESLLDFMNFLNQQKLTLPQDYIRKSILKSLTQHPFSFINYMLSQDYDSLLQPYLDMIVTKLSRIKKTESFPLPSYVLFLEKASLYFGNVETSPLCKKILIEEILLYSAQEIPAPIITQHFLSLPPNEKTWSSMKKERFAQTDFSSEQLLELLVHFSSSFQVCEKILKKALRQPSFHELLPHILTSLFSPITQSEDSFNLLNLIIQSTTDLHFIKFCIDSFKFPKKSSFPTNLNTKLPSLFSHLSSLSPQIAYQLLHHIYHNAQISQPSAHFIVLLSQLLSSLKTSEIMKEKDSFLIILFKKGVKFYQEDRSYKYCIDDLIVANNGSKHILEEIFKNKTLLNKLSHDQTSLPLILTSISMIVNETEQQDSHTIITFLEKLESHSYRTPEAQQLMTSLSPKNPQEEKKICGFLFLHHDNLPSEIIVHYLPLIQKLLIQSKKQEDTTKSLELILKLLYETSYRNYSCPSSQITRKKCIDILNELFQEKDRLKKNNAFDIQTSFFLLKEILKLDLDDFNQLSEAIWEYLKKSESSHLEKFLEDFCKSNFYSTKLKRIHWSLHFINSIQSRFLSPTALSHCVHNASKIIFKTPLETESLPYILDFAKEVNSLSFMSLLPKEKQQELPPLFSKQLSKITAQEYLTNRIYFFNSVTSEFNLFEEASKVLFQKYHRELFSFFAQHLEDPQTSRALHQLELIYHFSDSDIIKTKATATEKTEEMLSHILRVIELSPDPSQPHNIYIYVQLLTLYLKVCSNPKEEFFTFFFEHPESILTNLDFFQIEYVDFEIIYQMLRNLTTIFKLHPQEHIASFALNSIKNIYLTTSLHHDSQQLLAFSIINDCFISIFYHKLTSPSLFYQGMATIMAIDPVFLNKIETEVTISLMLNIFKRLLSYDEEHDFNLESGFEFVLKHTLSFLTKNDSPSIQNQALSILTKCLKKTSLQTADLIEKNRDACLFLCDQKLAILKSSKTSVMNFVPIFSPKDIFEERFLPKNPSYNEVYFHHLFDFFYQNLPLYTRNYCDLGETFITDISQFHDLHNSFFIETTSLLQLRHPYLLEFLLLKQSSKNLVGSSMWFPNLLKKIQSINFPLREIALIIRGALGIYCILKEKTKRTPSLEADLNRFYEDVIFPLTQVVIEKNRNTTISFQHKFQQLLCLGLIYIHVPTIPDHLLQQSIEELTREISSQEELFLLERGFINILKEWLAKNMDIPTFEMVRKSFEENIPRHLI